MLKLRQFKPSDIDHLRPNAIDEFLRDKPDYCKKWAEIYAKGGPAYTDEQITFSAGILLGADQTGLLWAVFSPEIKKRTKTTLRTLKEMLAIVIDKFELKTLYAESRKGFAVSQRMLEHFGFIKTNEENKTYYYYKLEV